MLDFDDRDLVRHAEDAGSRRFTGSNKLTRPPGRSTR